MADVCMNFPDKINRWLKNNYCPQRCLFSGVNTFELAVKLATQLNHCSEQNILRNAESDVLCLEDNGESFRIGDEHKPERNSARGLIHWVSQKPIAPHRIVILENFERASREAPQTLLKVLEEPPSKAIFLFTTKNHHQILPTILSRMTVVSVSQNYDQFEIDPEIKHFFEPGALLTKLKKIEQIESLIKKEGDKTILHEFIAELLLHSRYFPQYQKHLELIFRAQEQINRNINHRLILEQLAINLATR